MWFGKRHKRHKIRKPSNHAALRCGVLKIKNATRFFQVILFLYFLDTHKSKKNHRARSVTGSILCDYASAYRNRIFLFQIVVVTDVLVEQQQAVAKKYDFSQAEACM